MFKKILFLNIIFLFTLSLNAFSFEKEAEQLVQSTTDNAKKIILFGMDFGNRVGRFSNTKPSERKIKLKKLKQGKNLLEWLSSKTNSELFTTSYPVVGFKKVPYRDLDIIIT